MHFVHITWQNSGTFFTSLLTKSKPSVAISILSLHLRAIFNLSLESSGSVQEAGMEEQEASQRKEKRMQVTRDGRLGGGGLKWGFNMRIPKLVHTKMVMESRRMRKDGS